MECTEGSGAQCGAQYLTKGFENLLRRKLGARANEILTSKKLLSARKQFDNTIKTSFNPFDSNCDQEFEISIHQAPELPELGLEDGYLKLTKCFLSWKVR
jgi:hypothetical protein